MTDLHRIVAYSIPSGFLLMFLWALISFIRNKAPGDGYWRLLAVLQVVLGMQAIVGGILFLTGARPDSNGPGWLHYVYGFLFPVGLLVAAHRYSRRTEGVSWMAFGVAGLVIFGLTFRALQTGLGID